MKLIQIEKLNDNEFNELRNKIIKRISKLLTTKRFQHTLRVEETAIHLATIFHGDPRKVSIAALLHDYAKNYSDDEKIALCHKLNITLTQHESTNLDLVHSKLGAEIAIKKYHIEDHDVIHAIMFHTTGRPHMTLTEKIIYLADYIEPGRKSFPELIEVRNLAERNLDEAIIKKLILTIQFLIDKGQYIDPITRETYEYYVDLKNKERIH